MPREAYRIFQSLGVGAYMYVSLEVTFRAQRLCNVGMLNKNQLCANAISLCVSQMVAATEG